jgi:hypothetical protein
MTAKSLTGLGWHNWGCGQNIGGGEGAWVLRAAEAWGGLSRLDEVTQGAEQALLRTPWSCQKREGPNPCREQTGFRVPPEPLMRSGGQPSREVVGTEGQGVWMMLTQTAPGHNGARVARGDTLQHRGLVHCQGEVLRPHQNCWLLVGPRACAWKKRSHFLSSAWSFSTHHQDMNQPRN